MLFLVSYNFECFLRDQVIAGMDPPCNYRDWLPVNFNE